MLFGWVPATWGLKLHIATLLCYVSRTRLSCTIQQLPCQISGASFKRLDSPARPTHLNLRAGWHVSGGIIRYKETAEDRIRATVRRELGAEVAEMPARVEEHAPAHSGQKTVAHVSRRVAQETVLTAIRVDGVFDRNRLRIDCAQALAVLPG